jgi:exopolyphosphatase/guanosine-5'-triphosphate,3'-diphosphate pyrophosphatase
VWEGSKQTRLGKGFYQTHELQPGAISQTARAVAEFASAASKHRSKSIRIIATSAVREAINPNQLTDAIEKGTGLKVEILSGEQEADLVFQGVTTDPALSNEALLLLDVGGGSTEFILGHDQHKDYSASTKPLPPVTLPWPRNSTPAGKRLNNLFENKFFKTSSRCCSRRARKAKLPCTW